MNKKYSKVNLKKIRMKKSIVSFLIILSVVSLSLALYILLKKDFVIERIDDSAKFISDDVAKNSMPIIMNNVLIGGVYEKKWVSVEQFYLKSNNKTAIEIDVYNKKGKKGTYELSSISQGNTSTVYSATTNTNIVDEYFAIAKSDVNAMLIPATKNEQITDKDVEYVEKALGLYRLFNTTVKVTESYDITLSQGESGRIICATNQVGKSMGVYSTVVYVDNTDKAKIVKYNYIRDISASDDWPIYSFIMSGDLNLDGINEIIIQETKEFEVKYDVLEYKDGKFYEILSTVIK